MILSTLYLHNGLATDSYCSLSNRTTSIGMRSQHWRIFTSEYVSLDSDFNSTAIQVTFNSSNTGHCIEVQAFTDTLIEGPETFIVVVSTNDTAVISGGSVLVTIEDSNEGEVLVSLAESAYSVLEGEMVTVCIEIESDVVNLQRDVVLLLMTTNGVAQGMAV